MGLTTQEPPDSADSGEVPQAAESVEQLRSDLEPSDAIDRSLARIQARIERDLTRVERMVSAMFDRELEPTELLESVELCDALGSKFGRLGFGVSAELIRRTASLLESNDLSLSVGVAMASMLEDARSSMVSTIDDAKLLGRSASALTLIGRESESLDDVLWVALSQGMAVRHLPDGLIGQSSDSAAIVFVADHAELSRIRPLIRGVRERYPVQPLLVLAPPGTLAERAPIVDLVTTIMPRSLAPIDVVMECRRAMVRAKYERSVSVLGEHAEWAARELNEFGLVVRAERTAEDLLTSLQLGDARAALLLPNPHGPDPTTVLRAIRSDRVLRPTVVVVVSDRTDAAAQHQLVRDGADAVFPADADLDNVVVVLKGALERRNTLEPVADPDARHGAIPWPNASVLVERLLTLSFRRNMPMGLAIVGLPIDCGPTDLDEQIAREFRRDDVIARRTDDTLVIALHGVGRRTVLKRVADIHRKYGLDVLGVRSAGVEFPGDGRSLAELLQNASETLDRVEALQGPTVVGSGWLPLADQAADVLIVDPDETLGAVLIPLFERNGLRAEHEADALKALDLLTGHTQRPLPALVLLELDLNGIDGLQFLRQIREAGTASRFRVIILSSRTAESDLRYAFELGAEDFVGKPFSTPLLMHRVQRTLERR